MEECKVCTLGSLDCYRFVVIFARHRGQWVFCRHRERITWETAGGHIEPGESPLEAAKRELFEESGAVAFTIEPAFDYWVSDDLGSSSGVVFLAQVEELGPLPESEMAETALFGGLPEALTYPHIAPRLFEEICKMVAE